jgi:hypothetical protein
LTAAHSFSISTIQEHLKILEQRQLISKSRHRIDGGWGKNNVYTLLNLDNPEVYRSPAPQEDLPLYIGEETPV